MENLLAQLFISEQTAELHFPEWYCAHKSFDIVYSTVKAHLSLTLVQGYRSFTLVPQPRVSEVQIYFVIWAHSAFFTHNVARQQRYPTVRCYDIFHHHPRAVALECDVGNVFTRQKPWSGRILGLKPPPRLFLGSPLERWRAWSWQYRRHTNLSGRSVQVSKDWSS